MIGAVALRRALGGEVEGTIGMFSGRMSLPDVELGPVGEREDAEALPGFVRVLKQLQSSGR